MTDRSLAETLTQLIDAARSAANGAVSAAVFNVWADALESAKWQVERAAAARVGERPAWQPIETAKQHDGKRVLLYWETRGACSGYWHIDEDDAEEYGWRGDEDLCIPRDQHRCTHWMPLPDPPVASPVSAPRPPREEDTVTQFAVGVSSPTIKRPCPPPGDATQDDGQERIKTLRKVADALDNVDNWDQFVVERHELRDVIEQLEALAPGDATPPQDAVKVCGHGIATRTSAGWTCVDCHASLTLASPASDYRTETK